MKRYFIVTLLAFIFISCNNDNAENINEDSLVMTEDSSVNSTNDINISSISGCYLRVMQRDTLAASLTADGNTITGKLSFDNYQKDGSTGTIAGVVDKDILKLVYRFQSEGMNSVSEVYFKITADGLIHGIGEVAVKGDSAFYSDPANITYDSKDKLQKLPCNTLSEKYR